MDKKYVKVMFENVSGANKDVVYKLDEINIAKKWNPSLKDPEKMESKFKRSRKNGRI